MTKRSIHEERLGSIEARAGGRLGVYVLDSATQYQFGFRKGERFAHCSSFKLSLAAMVLAKSERGEIDGSEQAHWAKEDLMPVSPVTTANLASGLTLTELARATLVTSDNAAANILLRRLGGPAALTAFWRALGDPYRRIYRYEPALNDVPEGTILDTTTPEAMTHTVAALLFGSTLTSAGRATLMRWMNETETGLKRLRAGFPISWKAGDKTGTGIAKAKHTYVDIAFGGPPGRAPLLIAAYYEPAVLAPPMDPVAVGVLAEVGAVAAASMHEVVAVSRSPNVPLTELFENARRVGDELG